MLLVPPSLLLNVGQNELSIMDRKNHFQTDRTVQLLDTLLFRSVFGRSLAVFIDGLDLKILPNVKKRGKTKCVSVISYIFNYMVIFD